MKDDIFRWKVTTTGTVPMDADDESVVDGGIASASLLRSVQ